VSLECRAAKPLAPSPTTEDYRAIVIEGDEAALCQAQATLGPVIQRELGFVARPHSGEDRELLKAAVARKQATFTELRGAVARDDAGDPRTDAIARGEALAARAEAVAAVRGERGDAWVKAVADLLHESAALEADAAYLGKHPALGKADLAALAPAQELKVQAELDALLRALSPAWSKDHPDGVGAPKLTALHAQVEQLALTGTGFAALREAVDGGYRASDEYRLRHLEVVVNEVYERLLPGDAAAAKGGLKRAQALKAEGKDAEEIKAALVAQVKDSAAYRARFRSTSRSDWYLTQYPYNWACAPTTLAMALDAFGLAEATPKTRERVRRAINQEYGSGFWGNADALGKQARQFGLSSSFSPSRDPKDVRRALEEGYGVIVNGDVYNRSGHFVYIGGIDKNGDYIVGDPFWKTTKPRWNDADLYEFTHGGPNPPGFVKLTRQS
jgi:hypothetical protein